MAQVAAETEGAWIRKGATPEEVITPGPENRPIAHPYTKLMVANASVNQGAGFIMTSLAEARRRGIASDRLVYVGYGAAAHESGNFLELLVRKSHRTVLPKPPRVGDGDSRSFSSAVQRRASGTGNNKTMPMARKMMIVAMPTRWLPAAVVAHTRLRGDGVRGEQDIQGTGPDYEIDWEEDV